MKLNLRHALDVAVPSACLFVDKYCPFLSGAERERLVKEVSDHMVATLHAFVDLHPAEPAVPKPSKN